MTERNNQQTDSGGLSLSFHDLRVYGAPPPLPLLARCQRAALAAVTAAAAGSAIGRLPALPPTPPPKCLLNGVSGYIPANGLTGVMGGSGAGKTTLLNFLAHRLPGCGQAHRLEEAASTAPLSAPTSSVSPPTPPASATEAAPAVSGSIRVNGCAVSSKFFAAACGYVPQQSILLSSLTARESVRFASMLRLPTETSKQQQEENTERVLAALSLHGCAETRVGDELIGGGLSGGEKRRVNIGVELVTNPPLLFLDEPTTGLDSLTALNVLKTLKQLTRPHMHQGKKDGSKDCEMQHQSEGRDAMQASESNAQQQGSTDSSVIGGGVTVVCSIHQPSSEMFALLDHLLLLSAGYLVYCGPAADAIGYFSALGHPCPPLENPSEFFLDLLIHEPQLLPKFQAEYARFYNEHYRRLHQHVQHQLSPVNQVSEEQEQEQLEGREQNQDAQAQSGQAMQVSSPALLLPHSATTPYLSRFSAGPAPYSASAAGYSPSALFPRGSARLDLSVEETAGLRRKLRLMGVGGRQQEGPVQHSAPSTPVQQRPQSAHANAIHEEQQHSEGLTDVKNQAEPGPSVTLSGSSAIQASPAAIYDWRAHFSRCWWHLLVLTRRAHTNSSRLPLLKGAQLLQTVILGLLVGAAFYKLEYDQISVQNRLGCVYFLAICVIFANTLAVVLNFAEERALFLREQANQMYSVWVYFLARTSIDLLPTALCSLGLALICFWMIEPAGSFADFGSFLLILLLLAYCGQGIGFVVSCGIPSRMLALIVTPLAIAPFILFTPYAINLASMHWIFRPFQVGSPFWFGFSGLMLSMFSGVRFHCSGPSQLIPIPLADGSFHMLCPYETGEAVMARFRLTATTSTGEEQFWLCCGVLLVLSLLYRLLALLMLYKLSWNVKDATK